SYVAWEPSSGNFDGVNFEVGRTADKVKNANYAVSFVSNFSSDPILLTDMQTTDGGDTSVTRCETVTSSGFEVFIEEEKSRDTEINHTSEVVGYVAFQ
ncbi:MAG: fibronectin type III domain-containing protein, partial [Pseudomonadota bacterium]|nr:fibronectin type III domain-containing protein [Pseudomonadota bacterium]